MKIMTIAYILGSILLWVPTITAGMLSNLMNAEEQEQMIQNIKAMHKKIAGNIRSAYGYGTGVV